MNAAQMAARVLELPAEQQQEALECIETLYGGARRLSFARRDPAERRSYLGRPADYLHDVLGVRFQTAEQRATLELIERSNRVLIPKANAVGGTFVLAGYGIYVLDVLGAQLDEHGEEQGARVILMGPSADAIESSLYSEMLLHARNAERLGHRMPGRRSEASVLWDVRPGWQVTAIAPPRYVQQEQAHNAAGRHARVQVILITEGSGVNEALWKAADGLASSAGNKIIAETNPTEAVGPFHQRERAGGWETLHLSAFDHPNIRTRSHVVPGAIDFAVIDMRVRAGCTDRGTYPANLPDSNFGDLVYALPPQGAEERGPREDGYLGHPDGELRVYRPGRLFQSQVLGQWPKGHDAGLFSPGDWDAAVARWKAGMDPNSPPDRVGVDAAREGDDDTCCAPAWGDTAESLLAAHAAAVEAVDDEAIAGLQARRVRIGAIRTMPKGDGKDVAEAIYNAFPRSPWSVDEQGVGASVYDHASRVLGLQAFGVSFGAAASPPLPGEEICENLRATMYLRAATMVRLGLVDPPDDPLLREEVMAMLPQRGAYRSVEVDGKKVAKPCLRIVEKKQIKKRIGRSPDRADAFVLALHSVAFDARYTGNDILTSF